MLKHNTEWISKHREKSLHWLPNPQVPIDSAEAYNVEYPTLHPSSRLNYIDVSLKERYQKFVTKLRIQNPWYVPKILTASKACYGLSEHDQNGKVVLRLRATIWGNLQWWRAPACIVENDLWESWSGIILRTLPKFICIINGRISSIYRKFWRLFYQ